MPREAIRQFANEIEIPYLLHFTRAANLRSIMEHGILIAKCSSNIEWLMSRLTGRYWCSSDLFYGKRSARFATTTRRTLVSVSNHLGP